MDRSRVAIVIPAFNEAATIGEVVSAAGLHGDVIVVDDASTDSTVELAAGAGAHLVSNPTNLGYDGALGAGINEAVRLGYEAVVTLDADGEHDPAVLASFKHLLIDEQVPLVLGRRARPARWGEGVTVWVIQVWLGISDILCGCKGYRTETILANDGFDHCHSTGMELAVMSVRRGFGFEELDVPGRTRTDTPRFGQSWRANIHILGSLFRVLGHALKAVTAYKKT